MSAVDADPRQRRQSVRVGDGKYQLGQITWRRAVKAVVNQNAPVSYLWTASKWLKHALRPAMPRNMACRVVPF